MKSIDWEVLGAVALGSLVGEYVWAWSRAETYNFNDPYWVIVGALFYALCARVVRL